MTRAALIIALICGIAAAAYWQGGRNAMTQDREDTLTKSKEIGDAIHDADDMSWREWLLSRGK